MKSRTLISLFLLLLVVLASSEPRLQLVFYHLFASLLTRCRSPPSSPGPVTAAEGVTHLFMRAAIDSSLTPQLLGGGGGGVDGVELQKTICQG